MMISMFDSSFVDDFDADYDDYDDDDDDTDNHYLGGGFKYFFIFNPIWGKFPFWLIFFKWVETTN